jgi:Cysteine-rich CWC
MAGTLKSIAGLFVERWRDQLVCVGCGNEFTCGASLKGCWCSELKLSDQARSELASRYFGCLCPQCLELHSTNAEEKK